MSELPCRECRHSKMNGRYGTLVCKRLPMDSLTHHEQGYYAVRRSDPACTPERRTLIHSIKELFR